MITIDEKSLQQECAMVVNFDGVKIKVGGGEIRINDNVVTETEAREYGVVIRRQSDDFVKVERENELR